MVLVLSMAARSLALAKMGPWLAAGGAEMDSVSLQDAAGMGIGLVATRDLAAGDSACSVPRALLLTASSGVSDPELGPVLSRLRPVLRNDIDLDESLSLVALQLLAAARKVQCGESSRWAPYLAGLPRTVETPTLWPRACRTELLGGTTLLEDVRELRVSTLAELRRIRRALAGPTGAGACAGEGGGAGRAAGEWLERFGLDSSVAPCPLSGEDTPASTRWLLASSLARSRAYVILDDGEETHGAEEEFAGDELVLSPLLDLANHDDALGNVVGWGSEARGEAAV